MRTERVRKKVLVKRRRYLVSLSIFQNLIILNLAIECWEGVGRVSKMNTLLCALFLKDPCSTPCQDIPLRLFTYDFVELS